MARKAKDERNISLTGSPDIRIGSRQAGELCSDYFSLTFQRDGYVSFAAATSKIESDKRFALPRGKTNSLFFGSCSLSSSCDATVIARREFCTRAQSPHASAEKRTSLIGIRL